jgi:hypothetical protein
MGRFLLVVYIFPLSSFQGSPSQPADETVELTTAPSINDTTHWGQQVSRPFVDFRTCDSKSLVERPWHSAISPNFQFYDSSEFVAPDFGNHFICL